MQACLFVNAVAVVDFLGQALLSFCAETAPCGFLSIASNARHRCDRKSVRSLSVGIFASLRLVSHSLFVTGGNLLVMM